MTVRRRLVLTGLLVAALGAVPIATLGLSVSGAAERTLRDEVHERVSVTAQASARILDDAFTRGIAAVGTTAARPAFVDAVHSAVAAGDPTGLGATFKAFDAAPGVIAIFVADPDGTIVASLPEAAVRPDQARAWVRATARDATTSTSDAFDPGDGRGVAVTATSFVARSAADPPIGVLGVVFDLASVQSYVEGVAKAQDAQLTVVDRRGVLLATPQGRPTTFRHLTGPLAAAVKSGRTGLGRRSVGGHDLISAYAPITSLRWRVLAETPERQALAGARDIRSTVRLVVALLLVGLALLVAVVVRAERRRVRAEQGWRTARDEAVEASRLKSEFLANMSHEIRTPLNGVLGMTSLLLDSDLTADQRDLAETSYRSGEALLAIINDILDFSRIEAGKLDVETVEFDLRGLVEDVSRLLAATADTKDIELFCAVEPDVPARVLGDPTRIRQILSNLAGNAVKFTDDGEVIIRASVDAIDEDRLVARISVTDTGIGISADLQPRLFEAFTQADSSTTRRYGGSGLGLTISQRLTELMDGEIGLTSEPGAGSTFWFTVPLGVAPAQGPASEVKTHHPGMRVLVVDDNEVGRTLLQRMLGARGMDVTVADGGPAALETLQALSAAGRFPELVLLDLNMPELDGLGVTRAIRATYGAEPRIVLLTSSAQQGDARLGRDAGIDGYLAKPIRRDDLEQIIALVMATEERPEQLITRHVVREYQADRGTHLLLAEDNPVNQKVAKLTLERLGYRVDVADDGEAAVAALARHRYDAVLMDCQMPILDGFEATRRIRAAEGPGDRIPIIALTSSATAADRQRCLDAGMDAHVAKPLRTEELQEVLTRMTTPTQPEPLVDEHVIRTLAEAGGGELLDDLIDTFAADAHDQVDQLRHAVDIGDLTVAGAAAHRLRGAAGTLGATPLTDLCATIERAADAGRTADVAEAIPDLDRVVAETVAELRTQAAASHQA